MMWNRNLLTAVGLLLAIGLTNIAYGDARWIGGSGDPLNIWSAGANWDSGAPPASATEQGVDQNNIARMYIDGTTTLIDDSVDAVAFSVQLGFPSSPCPISLTNCQQAASNDLVMTGGTLTTQGNFLLNIGRGRNEVPTQLTRFMMSGGVVNAAGITLPESFNPDSVPGFTSVGVNAELHVGGDSVVNTDLLRLGAFDANSTVILSDNAQVNLTDDNMGFANGQLWLEAFEDLDNTGGLSVLDIRDNAVMTIHGGVNNIQDDQVASLALIVNELIPRGMIIANGGVGPNNVVSATLDSGVITLRAVSEPGSVLDGCDDAAPDSRDIESLSASFDEATGQITVVLTLCDAPDQRTKYRVHYDHTAPFATDCDRNGDMICDDLDFCVTTSDDTMMHRSRRDTGPGEIIMDENVLTYTVNMAELSADLAIGDTILVWADTQYKGIQDRAPDTDDSDGCGKPEVTGEFVELVLE